MKIYVAVAILLLLELGSVFAQKQNKSIIPRIPFPEEEYSALKTEGTATIHGQAFVKTSDGRIQTGAGEYVTLFPETSYSRQWYGFSILGIGNEKHKKHLADADPRYYRFDRKQVADTDGRFTFRRVPAGTYYLETDFYYYTGDPNLPQLLIYLFDRVTVSEGEEVDVVLKKP